MLPLMCVLQDVEKLERRASSFVAHHLGAPVAVVDVVPDADHSSGGRVVSTGRLNRSGAAHAAKHLDRGDGPGDGVHAGPEG